MATGSPFLQVIFCQTLVISSSIRSGFISDSSCNKQITVKRLSHSYSSVLIFNKRSSQEGDSELFDLMSEFSSAATLRLSSRRFLEMCRVGVVWMG